MTYKDILKVVPTIQSVSLVSGLVRKKKKRGLVGDATGILLGVPLIQAESDLIAGL